MRIIGNIEKKEECDHFSSYLFAVGINHKIETALERDWGSDAYGTPIYQVWIVHEEQVEQAESALEEFKKEPENPKFTHAKKTTQTESKVVNISESTLLSTKPKQPQWTLYIVMLCIVLFIWGEVTAPEIKSIPEGFPSLPLVTPALNKPLYFDYPKTFSLVDQLVSLYGAKSLFHIAELPPEGKFLYHKYSETPFWTGYYSHMVGYFTNITIPPAPLFEKIREGEIWRAFTPALLHYDVFHIFFNMIWLFVLGRQIEERVGVARYLLFILIIGILTNTFQYLMSGSNFLGFSGVLSAMFTFIWVREKRAPWEGYQMQPGTMAVLLLFVLGLFALQCISFLGEISDTFSLPISIANTAHLSGGALGFLVGRTEFLCWREGK